MHSGSGRQKSAVSVYVGIASLILEGRVVSADDDDENFLGLNSTQQQQQHAVLEEAERSTNSQSMGASGGVSGSGASRHGVINRISEKLMQLRQYPDANKDAALASIPVQSRDECDYERQPRLHHVASAREFQRNPRLTSIVSSSSALNSSSSAASVLHEIDVDWNDISLILNGLDSLIKVPSFPLKLTTAASISHASSFRASSASMPINSESMKLFKTKLQQQEKICGSPTSTLKSSNVTSSKPKQGPHCEKFLKKIGLLKVDSPSESDVDHLCNHVNSFCRRWQFHLKKLLQVLSKAEDACIEVYLGPENNAILLEQWILTLSDRSSSSTMTIQALCSAIRSQLYFSQISSWIDLLKKAFIDGDLCVKEQMPSLFCHEIMQNPRLKKNLQTMQVDLDILFRIRAYDGTSCFLEKPNVHNFPDTIVSDGMAICVCLKSLPRLEKIPTLNTEKAHLNGFSCDNRIKSSSSPVAGSSRHIINDRMAFSPCHEKGKHVCCKDDEEEDESNSVIVGHQQEKTSIIPTDLSTSSSSSSSLTGLSHRERQLLKYKKRLLKRDKQKKKQQENSEQHSSNLSGGSNNNGNSSGVLKQKQGPMQEETNFSNTSDINMSQVPLYNISNTNSVKKNSNDDFKIASNSDEDDDDEDEKEVEGGVADEEEHKSTAVKINNNQKKNTLSKRVLLSSSTVTTAATTTQLSIATQTEFNDTPPLLLSSTSLMNVSPMMLKQCDSCGNQLQCLICDKVKLNNNNNNNNDNIDNDANTLSDKSNQMATSPLSTANSSCLSAVTGTMIGKKSDLLLQAIQRTAIAHQNDCTANSSGRNATNLRDNFNDNIFSSSKVQGTRDSFVAKTSVATAKIMSSLSCDANLMSGNCDKQISSLSNSPLSFNTNNNNNNNNNSDNGSTYATADCRLCKRQKTKHTPSTSTGDSRSNNNNNCSAAIYRRTMSECMVGISPDDDESVFKSNGGMFLSPQAMHNCDDLQILNHSISSSVLSEDDTNKTLSYGELKAYRRAFSEDVINQLPNELNFFENEAKCNDGDDECILIKCRHKTNSSPVHKLTPNVTLQQQHQQSQYRQGSLDRDIPSVQLINSHQRIPKINLSEIFNSIQPQNPSQNDSGIGQDAIDFSPTSDDNVFIFNSPVKSYPPTIMQLSPRPNSSLSKRRSRHMSDRSSISISEFCSDEEDDISSAATSTTKCMPEKMQIPSSTKISSLYKKFVSKTQTAFKKFSQLPMLSTIEENLLHNRFQPKAIVEGFKLLLGASGSFCPTQLTIPAQTYFYEFHGTKHLSTPYVCEFRLARKYSIPRFGTVQATLLNPQGTVVRMFFVPYDFRQMPAMSQTFVRQRVLALDEHISQKNAEQMSTSDQMKYLRYVINLRFQTGRSGRLCLHTDIKLVISRRTEFDTAAAHAKNSLESPNDLKTVLISPDNPKFSSRIDRS